ncbi:MAG TPA: DUF1461 domain-containing protein [Candidatus Limnocylindria bacterium]|nr:DUF1461 domain-containing protein [Candidatus Limnocylindria bacterium]
MSTAPAAAALHVHERADARLRLLGAALSGATALLLLGLALGLLLLPLYMHPALDAAGSAGWLGVSREAAHALSDRTVAELLFGPGTFAFSGPDGRPFYGAAEQTHLRDVRLVLYAFLAVCAASGAALALAYGRHSRRALVWRAVGRGGALLVAAILVVGLFALVAFELAFDLFHRILFPGGNWAFDPASQRLVQLYPLAFWQLTAAVLGVLAASAGAGMWLIGRTRARSLEAAGEPGSRP